MAEGGKEQAVEGMALTVEKRPARKQIVLTTDTDDLKGKSA